MYVKLQNGQPFEFPYNLASLRKENPNTSFPDSIPATTLALYNVYVVTPTSAPAFDSKTHSIKMVVEKVNGTWMQVWNVEELPKETAAANIRSERDRYLAESDWRVTYEVEKAAIDGLGIQYPTVWADYRQALRDITSQPGFPHNVTWPDEPTT